MSPGIDCGQVPVVVNATITSWSPASDTTVGAVVVYRCDAGTWLNVSTNTFLATYTCDITGDWISGDTTNAASTLACYGLLLHLSLL